MASKHAAGKEGFSVIATILMIITFLLVIGFALGAISTMNLNLSTRSMKVTTANSLAEAAVAQILYEIEDQSMEMNKDVTIDSLFVPSTNVKTRYIDCPDMFKNDRPSPGGGWTVDVHFKDRGATDAFFSTDNMGSGVPAEGAQGKVPPYTMDLIITVANGTFEKHYQVWIKREWDYAIYAENSPVIIASSVTLDGLPVCPSEINGSIYSRFKPSVTSAYPRYVVLYTLGKPGESRYEVIGESRIPGQIYPASIFCGVQNYVRSYDSYFATFSTPVKGGTSKGNILNGRGIFSYPDPSCSPPIDMCVMAGNSTETIKSSRFDMPNTMRFDNIKPVDSSRATQYINEGTYPGSISLVESYRGDYIKPGVKSFTASYPEGGMPTEEDVEKYLEFEKQKKMTEEQIEQGTEEVYFLQNSIHIKPEKGATGSLQWDNGAMCYIGGGPSMSYPLVDSICVASVGGMNHETTTAEEYGVKYTVATFTYEVASEGYSIDPDSNDFTFDDALVIADKEVFLDSCDVAGDNCLLQVRSELRMNSGTITAGQNIGAAIYCNKLFCQAEGTFNGIIFVRDTMTCGRPTSSHPLAVRGGVVVKGLHAYGFPSTFDFEGIHNSNTIGGFVSFGFKIDFDPRFMSFLNRFGPVRVASWRNLD